MASLAATCASGVWNAPMLLTANATTMVLTAPSMPASVVVGGVTYYSLFYGGTRGTRRCFSSTFLLTTYARTCARVRARCAETVMKYIANTGNNYMVSMHDGMFMACITIAAPYTVWMHMSSAVMGLYSDVCPTTLAASCTGSATSGTLDIVVSARPPPPSLCSARPARFGSNTGAVLDDRATHADASPYSTCTNAHAVTRGPLSRVHGQPVWCVHLCCRKCGVHGGDAAYLVAPHPPVTVAPRTAN